MTKCTLPSVGGESDCGRRVPAIAWGGHGGRGLSRAKRVEKTIRGILFCGLFRRGKAVWGTAFLIRPLTARALGGNSMLCSMTRTTDDTKDHLSQNRGIASCRMFKQISF